MKTIMRRLVLSLAFVLALGGGVAYAQTVSPAPTTAPAPAPSPVSIVHVKNFAYAPASVTINAGQTVRFVQDDDTPHTVTAADKSFDSGNLDKGQSWTHTFATPGTYAYVCAYHAMMKGTVIVRPAP
jgi:plastocyanin